MYSMSTTTGIFWGMAPEGAIIGKILLIHHHHHSMEWLQPGRIMGSISELNLLLFWSNVDPNGDWMMMGSSYCMPFSMGHLLLITHTGGINSIGLIDWLIGWLRFQMAVQMTHTHMESVCILVQHEDARKWHGIVSDQFLRHGLKHTHESQDRLFKPSQETLNRFKSWPLIKRPKNVGMNDKRTPKKEEKLANAPNEA